MFKVVDMRRNQLCHQLRTVYTPERGFGVAKTAEPKQYNIWFVVPPAPPRIAPEKLPQDALRRAYQTLDEKIPPLGSEDELDRFVALLFQRREAVASSRMEGTWSTIDHVLTPNETGEYEGNTKSATASVRGYADALETHMSTVLKRRHKMFTPTFVKGLHKSIMAKDPSFDGTPGALRAPGKHRGVVFIGGLRKEDSIYNPAPPEHVSEKFKEVLQWYRDDLLADMGDAGMNRMTLPVRLAIGHAHFEAVHPFQDGNGRVGRMLWPFQMAIAGLSPLYLSGFVEVHKENYGRALGAAQKQLNYNPLIEFVCAAITESHAEAAKTKATLLGLPETWRERAVFRKNSAAARALPYLIKSPIMTANELSRTLDISFQAASNALKSLVERRVLLERTEQKRHRIFAAEEVLALIARPFGASSTQALKTCRRALLRED